MLTGDELRTARESAGLTQQQLGDALEVSMRSVGNWERADRVPPAAERRVRRAFSEWFGSPAAPLSSVSDAQLLAEIARRFDRGRQESDGSGNAAPTSKPRATGVITELRPDEDPGYPHDAAALEDDSEPDEDQRPI